MYSIYTTEVFDEWFSKLKDQQAKRCIQVRIDRVKMETLEILNQSVKVCLNYVFSLDLAIIYYCKQGQRVAILLAGGDKSTQSKDIKLALQLAQDLEKEL